MASIAVGRRGWTGLAARLSEDLWADPFQAWQ